jgi:predicted GNAT family acetyltransferase
MLIQRKQTENKGIFYVQTGAGIQAELTYHMSSPCQMIIEHTEVDEELRGCAG